MQLERTGDQLAAAWRAMNALSKDTACALGGLDIMRRINLESALLQGVGGVEGEVLRCRRAAALGRGREKSPF